MGLTYPPEWKFEDDEDEDGRIEVPRALRTEIHSLVEKIARGSEDEEWLVENFKTRFGDSSASSTLSWAWSDFSRAMAAMTNAAEFAEGFWLGVEDARAKGYVVPTLAHVNKLYAKHGFPFQIDPPHLRRTDQPPPTEEPVRPAGLLPPGAGVRWLPPGRPPFVPALPTDEPERPTGVRPGGPNPFLSPPPGEPSPPAAPTSSVVPPSPTTVAALAIPTTAPRPAVTTPTKPVCFVAQPFHGNYQNRYDEDLVPAIEAAGLVPYKIDKDPGVDHILPEIEEAIRNATFVVVDITEDNPNVWYELGYAEAKGRPVLMISCATVRQGKPYPFDVRGRNVLDYETGRRSAHTKLQEDVTTRIKARLARAAEKAKAATLPTTEATLAPPNGFATMDARTKAVFVSIVSLSTRRGHGVTPDQVAREVGGYAQRDVNIGTRVLERRGLIEWGEDEGEWGKYAVIRLSDAGEEFVVENHIHFETKPPAPSASAPYTPDDDIPF